MIEQAREARRAPALPEDRGYRGGHVDEVAMAGPARPRGRAGRAPSGLAVIPMPLVAAITANAGGQTTAFPTATAAMEAASNFVPEKRSPRLKSRPLTPLSQALDPANHGHDRPGIDSGAAKSCS